MFGSYQDNSLLLDVALQVESVTLVKMEEAYFSDTVCSKRGKERYLQKADRFGGGRHVDEASIREDLSPFVSTKKANVHP